MAREPQGRPSPARRRSPLRMPVVALLLTAMAALCWHAAPVDAARAKRHPKRPKEEALAVPKEPRRVPKEDFERQRATSSRANSTASGRHGRSLLQVRTHSASLHRGAKGWLDAYVGSSSNARAGLLCARSLPPLSPPRRPRRLRWATNNAGRGSAPWGTVSSPCSAAMGWGGVAGQCRWHGAGEHGGAGRGGGARLLLGV
jgi:hypothetical protein